MFKIEKANENDALQIAIVNVYTWKTQYTGLMPEELIDARIKNIEFSEEKIKERIKEDGNYIVVKKGNTVVGFVRYGKCDIKDYEEYGEIKALYLLEGFQGNGLGRELFQRAREELNNIGYKKMRINCLKGNPTLNFYIYMGGKHIGEFENNISGYNITEDIIIYD